MQKGGTDQGAQEKMGCESTRDAHASELTPHRAAAAIPSGCSGTPYPWLPPTSGGFTAGSSQEQGNEAAKPKTGKVNSPDRKAEGLFLSKPQTRQRTSWVKDTGNLQTHQETYQPSKHRINLFHQHRRKAKGGRQTPIWGRVVF